ncbi:MAG TPA: hypothetical protein VFD70_06020 [Anaerolineae bacterium]|nr:hypothetical protein [Anaerolineae bacterium]
MAQNVRSQHLVQWRIAILAGICAGIVFLIVDILYLTLVKHLDAWVFFRYAASLVLGERVLPPPSGFDAAIVLVGLIVNFVLAIVYALILAFIIHRWGLLVGVIGGALFGAAIYFINLYTFTLWFPWFFALHSVPFLISTILFGIVAGGVYELLDYDDSPFLPAANQGGVRP